MFYFFFLGQSDPAPLQHDMEQYKARMESFGFHAIVVDGHDVEELLKAFAEVSFIKILFQKLKRKNLESINWYFLLIILGCCYQRKTHHDLGQNLQR